MSSESSILSIFNLPGLMLPCLPEPIDTRLAPKILQIKVRVNAIVKNIVNGGLPPEHILEFLVALTHDHNFYPPDFLWSHETNAMQFDE